MMAALRPVLALSAALLLAAASCAGGGEWEDREVLKDIQSSPSRKKTETIPEIGAALPLTGRLAVYGKAVRDGLNLAYCKWCEREARLVVLDTKGTVEGTREAFTTLAERDSVIAVVGPCTSGNSLAAAVVAEKKGLPVILPTATAYELTKGRRWIFRTCFTDPLQGAALAILAHRTLKVLTVGVVVSPGDTYSLSLASSFEQAYTKMGGKVLVRARFGKELDPSGAVAAVKALPEAPQALFVPAYAAESARLVVEARKAGFTGLFLGGDGWHTDELIGEGGAAVEGSHFTTHFVAGDPRAASKRFVSYFSETYGRSPGAFEALGYDAGLASIRAMRNAESNERQAMRAALSDLSDLPGATGSITIDEFGNSVKNAVVAKIEGGVIRFARRIRFRPGIR
ncbi:MAG: ABC transporter substrate-binding protein [Planctomycetota bacterium]|jgi:branched-chain amino acid transport system substrate-binding protein